MLELTPAQIHHFAELRFAILLPFLKSDPLQCFEDGIRGVHVATNKIFVLRLYRSALARWSFFET